MIGVAHIDAEDVGARKEQACICLLFDWLV
jgi:hypothetical protein